MPNREEECRDAARVTLRLPLPSLGFSRKDFVDVAKMSKLAGDSDDEPLGKLLEYYEKIREHEKEDNSGDKSPKQTAMETQLWVTSAKKLDHWHSKHASNRA